MTGSAELKLAAFEVMQNAHAPYSNFRVGAAIRTVSGEIVRGCNVENASFPMSVCAENVAIATAVAMGYREFTEIAIATEAPTPTPPCGGCRQILSEFAPRLQISSYTREGGMAEWSLQDLLPDVFALNPLLGNV